MLISRPPIDSPAADSLVHWELLPHLPLFLGPCSGAKVKQCQTIRQHRITSAWADRIRGVSVSAVFYLVLAQGGKYDQRNDTFSIPQK